ncbi:HAD-IA family hydrolase [uncultured Maritalea sp.]|jgi:phosphoglycolate phosphatase|uniref:HAD-IA family hydrolase n=1 Tax=uncultured Maritalea sp. TaxID=757249 RepID=UPI002604B8AD|nr:HAD-IA family hydrolase [uncultured Maritalea sp.]
MRLVIFDVDGTIVDSAAHIVESAQFVFHKNNLPKPADADIRAGIGLNLDIIMLNLLGDNNQELALKLEQDYRDYFNHKIEHGLINEQIYTGAAEAIATLGAQDETFLGIATGKRLKGVERLFKEQGFGHHFHTLQTPDNNPSKPNPGMVLTAMNDTGVLAEKTVMIGDTSYDMAMAKAAGVKALGVNWGYHDHTTLRESGADLVIDHYHQLIDAIDELTE